MVAVAEGNEMVETGVIAGSAKNCLKAPTAYSATTRNPICVIFSTTEG